jgi:EAL domain-containing protein (putative c-di-GMP-specific phosphodiesterase class I)
MPSHDKTDDVSAHISILETRIKVLEAENEKLREKEKEFRQKNQDIQQRLHINGKSGLPNHLRLNQDMVALFDEENDRLVDQLMGIFIVKLDHNFDMVNKTLKPSMSEWVIYSLGTRMTKYTAQKGSVYHTRDDEFIIILQGVDSPASAEKIAREIEKVVSKSHIFSGYHIAIGCSIGISLFPEHGFDKRTLLHCADIALGAAREQTKPFQIYSEELKEQVVEKMELQNYIIKALEVQAIAEIDKQFELEYQPIVKIAEGSNGSNVIEDIQGESLIRWHHPEKGTINPGRFIPISEETGLIIPIGNWVLYTAADQIARWRDEVGKNISLSLNLSPVQFSNEHFIDSIERILETKSISPDLLRLEITESCVMEDPIDAIDKIKKLRDMGITISIDDFGKGYSSLNYLRRFPVNTLKIDKSFVDNITSNQFDQVIVKAIIALAKELNLNIVVEGIETEEQFSYLLNEGCRMFQGFLFSKSLKAPDFQKFYEENIGLPVISSL